MPDWVKTCHSIGSHDMTWTDPEDGVTHAWAHVTQVYGDAIRTTKCDLVIHRAYYVSNDAPTDVTCLECIANPHNYPSVPRRSIRLRDEP